LTNFYKGIKLKAQQIEERNKIVMVEREHQVTTRLSRSQKSTIIKGLVQFIIRCVKCLPISIFGLFLVLAIIFTKVSPTSPLLFLVVIASYISGIVLVVWAFTTLMILLLKLIPKD